MNTIEFTLIDEYIELAALLKATGLADSGGQAKHLVTSGEVEVDGATEIRRGAKLRAGQTVSCHGTCIVLRPA